MFSWPSSTHRQVNDGANFVVCSFERPTELNAVPAADIYYEVKFHKVNADGTKNEITDSKMEINHKDGRILSILVQS